MLERYWKIGTDYYREFNNTALGRVLAGMQFSLLPPCSKAISDVGDKILVGSFGGTRKVVFESFYAQLGVGKDVDRRVASLEKLYESAHGEPFPALSRNPRLRLELLERRLEDEAYKFTEQAS